MAVSAAGAPFKLGHGEVCARNILKLKRDRLTLQRADLRQRLGWIVVKEGDWSGRHQSDDDVASQIPPLSLDLKRHALDEDQGHADRPHQRYDHANDGRRSRQA